MKKRVGFFLSLLLSFVHSFGQQYNFLNYTQENGLPQSYVYSMKQTPSGFMAVGTGDGLSFFSGSKFKTFTVKDGLAENFVTALENGNDGALWIGHFQKGISCLRNNKFSVVPDYDISWGPVNTLYALGAKLIAGTRSGKLLLIENNTIRSLDVADAGSCNALLETTDHLWLGTNSGVLFSEKKGTSFSFKPLKGTEGKKINALSRMDENWLIAGTADGELLFIKNTQQGFVFKNTIKTGSEVRTLLCTEGGNIWAGTFGNGLFRAEVEASETDDVLRYNTWTVSVKNGLKSPYVQYIYQDFEGNKWIGTYGGGLFMVAEQNLSRYTLADGLLTEQILSIASSQNILYTGTENGLQVFNPSYGSSTILYNESNGFVNDMVNCLAQVEENGLLIGTKNNGLWSFDKSKKKFKPLGNDFNIPSKTINHISITQNKNYVISTIDGIYFYSVQDKKTSLITTLEGLPHNNIQQTWISSAGIVWIAADNSPLTAIKGSTATLYKDIPGFRSFSIKSITGDEKETVLFGTEGDGLFIYDGKNFRNINTSNGLLSNYVYGVIYEPNKKLVICTHKNGISMYSLASGKTKIFGAQPGFPALENSLNSWYNDGEGKIYLGAANGIGVYETEAEDINFVPPLFNILQIAANKQIFTEKDSIISLPYGEYNIHFDFLGISFKNTEGIKYYYKIDGLHQDFKVTNEKALDFPKIKDGEFVFRIYAANADGVRSGPEKVFTFIVDKPLYKKVWFILVLSLSSALLIYIIFLWRIRSLERANRLLEERVKEKTKKIEEDKKVIEVKNLEITSSIDYAKRIQVALLPRKQDIQKELDSVVFYKPRNIVSGDFYWFTETVNYYYFAVVDCTGHGVPGAFMSLIGSTYLNQIIAEYGEPLPAEILKRQNDMLVKALKQKSSEIKVKDGMDMGLIRIEKSTRNVVFSGAVRPLYRVSDGEVHEYKSTMFSLGGFMEEMEKKFTNTDVPVKKGDWLYLCSDGFGDQFGGEKMKRYSVKNLKNLFILLASHSPQDQYTLLRKELKSWRGNGAQTDDILIAGIKI